MAPLPVLMADQVYEYVEPYVKKLPELTVMPLLADNIPAYVMAGLGVLFFLVFLIRLLTLRIFRAIFALIATALVSYYPLAYGFHYWWFTYRAPEIGDRELESWETFITADWARTDYIIMAVGGVLGLLLLWLSRVRKPRDYGNEDASGQPQHQGRPAGSKNPFDFQ